MSRSGHTAEKQLYNSKKSTQMLKTLPINTLLYLTTCCLSCLYIHGYNCSPYFSYIVDNKYNFAVNNFKGDVEESRTVSRKKTCSLTASYHQLYCHYKPVSLLLYSLMTHSILLR